MNFPLLLIRQLALILRYTDDTTLMAESKEELKSVLMKVQEESEKAGLKLSIEKTKIIPSIPFAAQGHAAQMFLAFGPAAARPPRPSGL